MFVAIVVDCIEANNKAFQVTRQQCNGLETDFWHLTHHKTQNFTKSRRPYYRKSFKRYMGQTLIPHLFI